MALIHIKELHIHVSTDEVDALKDLLIVNNKNQQTIMAQLDDLKKESSDLKESVADLQKSLDAEQAKIQSLLDNNASVVQSQEQTIADLESKVAAGISPELLQPIIDDMRATKDSIIATKADLESTVADSPTTSPVTPESPATSPVTPP